MYNKVFASVSPLGAFNSRLATLAIVFNVYKSDFSPTASPLGAYFCRL
jgi:hypothetical protein